MTEDIEPVPAGGPQSEHDGPRFSRLLILLVVVVAVAAAAASGVTYVLVRHDSPNALPPVVYTGVLRDTSGRPIADALLDVTATDMASIKKPGDSARSRDLAQARTDSAGSFTLRLSQSDPFIRKLAAEQGYGWVRLDVYIRVDGHTMLWGTPRQVSHHGWLTDEGESAALKVERLTFQPQFG